MKKAGVLFITLTTMTIVFVLGFLAGRNTNRSELTMISKSPSTSILSTEPASKKVNVNTASEVELTLLPGIGNTLAKRIIDYRNTIGPFRDVYDLCNVEGISERKLMKILDYIAV